MVDVRQKAEKNNNPFLEGYSIETDEYYSRVRDTEVYYYIPELKKRILRSIELHPPLHPDDWMP
jgi:hypothetical protein